MLMKKINFPIYTTNINYIKNINNNKNIFTREYDIIFAVIHGQEVVKIQI